MRGVLSQVKPGDLAVPKTEGRHVAILRGGVHHRDNNSLSRCLASTAARRTEERAVHTLSSQDG
jgi:hypothetical protein